ncbi:MAG: leucine-rich repeat protein [Holosporales bacterium]
MAFSSITRTLGLVTLLGSSLSPLQATEVPDFEDLPPQSTRFDDLPEDAVLQVMTFLPDRDVARLGLTSKAVNVTSKALETTSPKALRAMVHGTPLKYGVGEEHHLLQDLPTLRVQHILEQIAQEDQYLAVPMNSDLCALMPETLRLADLADWRAQLPLAMPLYEAAFGKDFPDTQVDLALQHLLAVLDTRVYVQRHNVNKSFAQFAAKKAQSLIQSLQNQRQARPFVNLLHGNADGALLATQPHTLVFSDAELTQPETQQKLNKILATQTADHAHPVILSVGYNPQLLKEGTLHLGSYRLPFKLCNLTVTNPSGNVTSTGSWFLSKQKKLISLRLAGFQNIYQIGRGLLDDCSSLTSVDLSSFKNVSQIGSDFLSGCSSMTSVDLSPFKRVTQIGSHFLYRCCALTSLDLSVFKNVTVISDSFLVWCAGLTHLDLSAFKKVTQIGSSFLSVCTGLTSLNLSAFKKVTQIGASFLSSCSALTSLDLSSFKNVTQVGVNFLYGCSSLTSVDLSPFKNVTIIEGNFLYDCGALTHVDLSGFRNVKEIRGWFLSGCRRLTSVDLSAFKNVTTIGSCFLIGCSSLTSVNLSPLRNVTHIGFHFLYGCSGLTGVDLSSFGGVHNISDNFLAKCSGLTSVDLSGLRNVKQICPGFISNCTALTPEAQKHVRAFCKKRGMEWKPEK